MEHLKLQAPRPSFDIALSDEGNARHFRGRFCGISLLSINLKAGLCICNFTKEMESTLQILWEDRRVCITH